MIYLIHNNEEINEISLIYYVEPPKEFKYYKEIEEKDLPKEKEGHSMKLIYNKTKDVVTAEYIPIPPTEDELLRADLEATKKELQDTKLELSMALVELTEMVTTNQKA